MNIEEMDGFFAALICAPSLVPLGEYLPEIWGGGDSAPLEARDDMDEFFNLTMRHWNSVARELDSADEVFIPWLETKEGEEFPRGNDWAKGFLRAIELCREDWQEIFEDEDKFVMLLPVLALVHENDPDPELRSWKTPPSRELRETICAGLGVSAQKIYRYFRPHRIREGRRAAGVIQRTEKKIGRNDPCFCGSGKKYKRCCGAATVH